MKMHPSFFPLHVVGSKDNEGNPLGSETNSRRDSKLLQTASC